MDARSRLFIITFIASVLIAGASVRPAAPDDTSTLLNVSYDPTRELYQEINARFAATWKAKTGRAVTIKQSHGGSGKQARAVIDGLQADVVTLALGFDIDAIQSHGGLVASGWQKRLPHNSTPYTSTIVFVVRKGNPKGIRDWDDLAREGVAVITPNPKTSGGARWNYLAAWGYAMRRWNSEARARDLVTRIFRNVPVFDSGARGATTTFVQRGIGDVMIAWENEALLACSKSAGLQTIVPSITVLAEPPVAIVDKVVDKHGTRAVAQAYLEYLFTDDAQEIAAKHYYRPRMASVLQRYAARFPAAKTFTISELFGDWAKAHAVHFRDGGVFDQITAGRS